MATFLFLGFYLPLAVTAAWLLMRVCETQTRRRVRHSRLEMYGEYRGGRRD